MTEDRTGRELTPRPTESEGVVAPREPSLPAASPTDVDRFAAGEQAHTVGLTEERAAQIVRQTSNSKTIAFLATLIFVVFIPLYWLYDIGLPVLGVDARLDKEANAQYVTDVKRGYALFLANCARCHGNNGEGGVGPPLNDQAKLFNAVTPQGQPGTGHLNRRLHPRRARRGRSLRLRRPEQRHACVAGSQGPAELPRDRGDHRLPPRQQGPHLRVPADARRGRCHDPAAGDGSGLA